jgi:hypothetical protein
MTSDTITIGRMQAIQKALAAVEYALAGIIADSQLGLISPAQAAEQVNGLMLSIQTAAGLNAD